MNLTLLLSVWLTVDPSANAASTTPPPTPTLHESARPKHRGVGLLVSGGLVAGLGFGLKSMATAMDIGLQRDIQNGFDPSVCIEPCSWGFLVNAGVVGPATLTSIGLLGAGMGLAGRDAAYRDALTGRAPRRAGAMIGLGAGLLGAGAISFAGFMGAAWGTDRSSMLGQGLTEAAWWSGMVLGTSGSLLLGYGLGYQRYRKRVHLALAPAIGGDRLGLAISGRF